jgi:hypothetical protein
MLRAIYWFLLTPIFSIPSNAQVPDPSIVAMAPIPNAGHEYIGMAAETVNPQDGSLTIDLPLQTPQGRLLNFPFGLHYGSYELFQPTTVTSPSITWYPVQTAAYENYGWSYLLPTYSAIAYTVESNPNPNPPFPNNTTEYCDGAKNFVFRIGSQQFSPGINVVWPDPNSSPPPRRVAHP